MYKPFPVISIEGDAHECGAQHGAKAADRVAKTIEFYLPSFVKQAKLTLDEVRERARGYGARGRAWRGCRGEGELDGG